MSSTQSSTSTRGSQNQQILCHCHLPCVLYIANTERNHGRKFIRCPRNRTEHDCRFFQWIDEQDQHNILMKLEAQNELIIQELKSIKAQEYLWRKFCVVLVLVIGVLLLCK